MRLPSPSHSEHVPLCPLQLLDCGVTMAFKGILAAALVLLMAQVWRQQSAARIDGTSVGRVAAIVRLPRCMRVHETPQHGRLHNLAQRHAIHCWSHPLQAAVTQQCDSETSAARDAQCSDDVFVPKSCRSALTDASTDYKAFAAVSMARVAYDKDDGV